jgi:hypothetical protein
MSPFTFASRVTAPEDVLVRELEGESVLLNLANNQYYGLDAVGTGMWRALTTTGSVQEAYDTLLTEYDVAPEALRRDLGELIEKLMAQGLLKDEG